MCTAVFQFNHWESINFNGPNRLDIKHIICYTSKVVHVTLVLVINVERQRESVPIYFQSPVVASR